MDTLVWWDKVVKPGIRKLGIKRNKQLNIEKRETLNLLMLRQSNLSRKIQMGIGHVQLLGRTKDNPYEN